MSEWEPRYLHRVGYHASWLDHRVLPEVGAMLAAMMSRVPKGGIIARYREVVEKIAKSGWEEGDGEESWRHLLSEAEEMLCTYINGQPHPIIQEFFDIFVGRYGHGSVKELSGRPVVFIEHISWWFAYLTFDNPLVKGQEMSTRAVWRKDWPMAGDSFERLSFDEDGGSDFWVDDGVTEIHKLGLEIAWHETEAWKVELKLPCEICDGNGYHHGVFTGVDDGPVQPIDNLLAMEESGIRGIPWCSSCNRTGKKYPWMNDPQAFRPAFDRARWALPGTIETGVSHCADVRTMGRVLKVMEDLAVASGQQSALTILEEVKEAYRQAMPGMAGMWLREAVHDTQQDEFGFEEQGQKWDHQAALPGHISMLDPKGNPLYTEDSRDVHLTVTYCRGEQDLEPANVRKRKSRREYADPYFNHFAQVHSAIRCSLACTRDWHRHRTMMPWRLRVVRDRNKAPWQIEMQPWGSLKVDHHYEPISKFGKENFDRYIAMCTELHDKYMAEGNQWMAMLCLPLGTRCLMDGQGGLTHDIYMNELRGYVAGANFEYQEQAQVMLKKVEDSVARWSSGRPGTETMTKALAFNQDPAGE